MALDNQNYDAELVVIADSEVDKLNPFRAILKPTDQELGIDLGILPFDVASKMQAGSRKKIDQSKLGNEFGLDLAKVGNSRQILEIIRDGRIKIGFLIDTDGGDALLVDEYEAAIKYFRTNGATVHAYVTGHAMSAGFSIMNIADSISVLNSSVALWHFTDLSSNTRVDAVKNLGAGYVLSHVHQTDLDDLRKFLARSKSYTLEDWKGWVEEITEIDNEEGELAFDGEAMSDMGITDLVHTDVVTEAKQFSGEFALSNSALVRQFWAISDYLAEEAGSTWYDFDFESARQALKNKQFEDIYCLIEHYRKVFGVDM